MLVNKYFSNDMSYFNLINGIYDTAIYDIVLIDSKEFINVKEEVNRIFKLNEKKFKGVYVVKNSDIGQGTSRESVLWKPHLYTINFSWKQNKGGITKWKK